MTTFRQALGLSIVIALGALTSACGSSGQSDGITLRNVSYDPTRELYQEINAAFAAQWEAQGNGSIHIEQSHGGSGKQARAVIDGLEADVVTLGLAYDIDAIAERANLLPIDWPSRLPNNSTPFHSTIVFLVREGNPKGIQDWDDLVRPGISVITPHPKTSGGARWNYLAAWGYALQQYAGDDARAGQFVADLYRNVPVLDSGARGSTTTFAQRQLGDVLIGWENEAYLAQQEFPDEHLEIVAPSTSILAEPPVALVDSVVDRRGTRQAAEAYLEFLYSPEAQAIAAKHHYRPSDTTITEDVKKQFPVIQMFSVDDLFGGWQQAQKRHFMDGGVFDEIYQPGQ